MPYWLLDNLKVFNSGPMCNNPDCHGWPDLHRVHGAVKDLFTFSACQMLCPFISMVVRMADPSHQDDYGPSCRNKQAEWTSTPSRNWTHLGVFIVKALHRWEVTLKWNFILLINYFYLLCCQHLTWASLMDFIKSEVVLQNEESTAKTTESYDNLFKHSCILPVDHDFTTNL